MKKRKIPEVDCRSQTDPLNYFTEDYNITDVPPSEELIDYYIQQRGTVRIPDELRRRIKAPCGEFFDCRNCPITLNGKSTCSNERINCGKECRFWVHGCARPVVMTIRGGKYSILISRTNLMMTWKMKHPCWIRTGQIIEVYVHHRDGNPYNDMETNLSYELEDFHPCLFHEANSKLEEISRCEKVLNRLLRTDSPDPKKIKSLRRRIKLYKEITNFLLNRESNPEALEIINKIISVDRFSYPEVKVKVRKRKFNAIQDVQQLVV